MLGLGLSLQKGVSAFNAGRALVSSYIRRVTDAGGVLQNTACDVAAINELNQDRLLEPASWVLVPDGIKEDVVYAQKPSTGLGDLTFTRASDATYTDSTGVVRRSPYNLLTYSEQFNNAAWTKTRSTITIDAIVAPNGTLTADKLVEDTNLGSHDISQSASMVGGISYTASVYAKISENRYLVLRYLSGGAFSANYIAIFDLLNGTATNSVGFPVSAFSITNVGNGWYRCTITQAANSTGSGTLGLYMSKDGVQTSYTGNGIDGIFIWGAQLVEGTSALDYFPTTNRQDVPRIDFRNADGTLSSCGRLLLEPQRTNSIRNSSMVGAVAGSPGTLPTNWSTSNAGLTRTIVGVGIENGLPYTDVRFNGTASGTIATISFETNSGITASVGQVWSNNVYVKNIDTTSQANQVLLTTYEYNLVGTYLTEGSTNIRSQLTTSLKRFDFVRTLTSATVARVQPLLQFALTIGQSYDFTIRIAAPQMELGAYATTWVPTTTAAVTRITEFASKTGVSSIIGQTEGTLFVEVDTAVLGQVFSSAFRRLFALSDNSISNRIIIVQSNTDDSISLTVTNEGVAQASISTAANQSGIKKIAVAYANDDFVLYVNGVQIGTDTSGTVPACSRLAIGYETTSNLSNPACPVAQAALFTTRLTNDQLEVLTSEGYGNYALLAESLNYVLQ